MSPAGNLLYFRRNERINVLDLSANGGCRELEQALGLVADANGHYFVRDKDQGTVEFLLSAANVGGDLLWDTRLPPFSDPETLHSDGNFIYYYSDLGAGGIRRREKLGDLDELVADVHGCDVEGLAFAISGDQLYWTLCDGSLYHQQIGLGAEPELMSRQLRYDGDDYRGLLLVDSDYVYWHAPVDSALQGELDPFPILRTCRVGTSQ